MEIECNLPFQRLPVCACDPGHGKPPTRLQRLECRARRGRCSLQWEPSADKNLADKNGVEWAGER